MRVSNWCRFNNKSRRNSHYEARKNGGTQSVCSCVLNILWRVWATSKHAAKNLKKNSTKVFSCVRTKLGV